MPSTRRTSGLAATAVLVLIALTGCGGGDDKPDAGGSEHGASSGGGEVAVIEECVSAFPGSFGTPDLGEVEQMPADWPEPPVEDAVLCGTASTLDDGQEDADYATSAAPEAVLEAYAQALEAAGYTVEAEDPSGLGRSMLSGTAGEVYYQVVAKDGGFTITFAGQSDAP